MDFDNPKVYGDTFISDGLVHFGPGFAGSFGALLVGRLVVVARGLYLVRHLFTLL